MVIFGGGSGLSQLMKGLIQFPFEITAVVSVADNGKSTGKLREEFSTPAVGDITKVLMAMSSKPSNVKELFNYRFKATSSLDNHSIKNLIMTALLEIHGNFAKSLPILCNLLDVKGKILPLTEDNVQLVGITNDNQVIKGEEQITEAKQIIKELKYDKEVRATPKVLDEIKKADIIVISSGSLLTSIMPHLIVPEISEAIKNSHAKKLYVCNMITQPGETDNFTVSDHLKKINQYLGENTIDAVIANNAQFTKKIAQLVSIEGKAPVPIDEEEISKMNIKLIQDKLYKLEENILRHDPLKTAYLILSYLMDGE